MRILVVEDDVEFGIRLQSGLREQGYSVDFASRLDQAVSQAASGVYDLLILDRMLEGGDGIDVLNATRDSGVTSPVIFLTARSHVRDRIAGLDAGADDYLVKPVSFPELLARVRVVFRRNSDKQASTLQVDNLRLDPVLRSVVRGTTPVDLSAKEFALLQFLMSHAGHVVSRSMILEQVWKLPSEGLGNVVEVHINRLRKKIDSESERPLIHTLRGVGYVVRAN